METINHSMIFCSILKLYLNLFTMKGYKNTMEPRKTIITFFYYNDNTNYD